MTAKGGFTVQSLLNLMRLRVFGTRLNGCYKSCNGPGLGVRDSGLAQLHGKHHRSFIATTTIASGSTRPCPLRSLRPVVEVHMAPPGLVQSGESDLGYPSCVFRIKIVPSVC